MTVENTNPIQHFTANGETTVFAISFAVEGKDNIKVTVNGSVVSVNDYSYDALTKAVVFNAAPEDGAEVVVERVTSLDRSINYQTYDNSFRPETLNYDLDRIWHVLQEDKITDAEILARIKDEIEWRRTHNTEWDLLAQAREQGLFNALKSYMDTIGAMSVPNLFDGITDNVVITEEGVSQRVTNRGLKQAQAELLEALNSLNGTVNVNLAEAKTYTDDEKARAVAEETRISNSLVAETNRSIAVEQALQSQINAVGVGNKAYLTYAEMDADKANNPINSKLEVTNDPDPAKNGTYQWNGTTLTKSAFDPVQISKNTTAQITREQNSLRNYFTTDMFTGAERSVASSGTIEYGDGFVTLPASTGFVLKRNLLAATTISVAVTIDEIANPNIKVIRRLADNSILEINLNRSETIGGKTTLYFDAVSFLSTDIQFSIYTYSRTHTVRNVSILNSNLAYVVKHDDNVNTKIASVRSELTTGYYQKEVINDFPYPNLDNVNLYGDPAITVAYPSIDNIDYFQVTKPLGVATGNTSFAGWEFTEDKLPDEFRIDLKNILITQVANINTILFRVQFIKPSGNQSLSVPLTKDAVTGKYNGFADFVKPSDTTRVRIYPSFTAMSGYASDVSFSIPIGGLVVTDLQKPNTLSSLIESSYNTDPFKTAVENIIGGNIEIDLSSIEIASVQSAFSNAVSRGELIFKDGVLTDVNADFNYISWWGSSSIAGMSPYLTTMATSLGVANKYNGGRSGEIMQYHAARMGAVNAMVKIPTGSIPASGKVEVTCNLPNIMYAAMGTFTGYLNGVLGTFGYDSTSSTQLSFTRAVSGSAIQVDPVKDYEFVPNLDQKNIGGYVILNVGKNNILYNSTYNETAEDIFAYTMRMYEHVRNTFKRVIVLNHYCNTNFNAKQIEITKQLNALLAKQFGNCLVDNNAYLLSEQVWIDTGFTKTQADIDAIERGVLPPTLSSDALHMNGTTVQALIRTQVKPKIQSLWFS